MGLIPDLLFNFSIHNRELAFFKLKYFTLVGIMQISNEPDVKGS